MPSLRDVADLDSDVTRGVVTGLAFLVALAFNLDPERRVLAVAVFGGGALAFFALAFLASRDKQYGVPQLRWYLFAAWGVLLFAVGLSTQSTIGVVLGLVVAVYAALRGWLLDALGEDDADSAREDHSSEKDGSGEHGGSGDRDISESGGDGDGWPDEDDEAWTGDALPPNLQPPDGDDPTEHNSR